MPGLPGLQGDIKTQPAVGAYRRQAVAIAGVDDDFAAEIFVVIGESHCLPAVRPRCGNTTAAYDMVAFHFKYVGEVRTDRDLEIKAHWFLTVVRDVDVLVQAPMDVATDHEAQRARCDRAILGN